MSRAGCSHGARSRTRRWTSPGSVRFHPAPAGRGTEIKVILTYAPPGGKVGRLSPRSWDETAIAWSGRRCDGSSSSWRRGRLPRPRAGASPGTARAGGTPGPERLTMKAVCWHAPRDVRVESVPDPELVNPRDAIVQVTSTAICGSDLHLYDGVIPTMEAGDILGHEFMGEVVEVGTRSGPSAPATGWWSRFPSPAAVPALPPGLTALCDNTNPNAAMAEALYGFSGAGLFGYSHLYGGYAGGQAELVRVPFADVGPITVPET